MTLTVGSLFAGIGGLDLGFERAGFQVKWQVEIDDYCNRVLAKHWPYVERFRDVRECGRHNLAPVDLVCGGFPCQPFSNAGKRRGETDDRNLWPEMRRIVQELKPRWVVGENVPGLIDLYLDQVLADLEALGYEAWSVVLPAAAFDAPHIRSRLYVVAYADSQRPPRQPFGQSRRGYPVEPDGYGTNGHVAYADDRSRQVAPYQQRGKGEVRERADPGGCGGGVRGAGRWAAEPGVRRVAHGIPHRVDRLRALGNAVVPEVAEHIGRCILAVESEAQ